MWTTVLDERSRDNETTNLDEKSSERQQRQKWTTDRDEWGRDDEDDRTRRAELGRQGHHN
jgi:hypothetical protein